jgi:hypothetical protein
MDKYTSYMTENFKEVYGKCAEATQQMAVQFPELQRVRGHYYCPVWGEREHWWLKTQDGEIIDPTASQFPSKGHGEYIEWIEGTPEPPGVCLNCGSYVYDNNSFCCKRCENLFIRDLYAM